ncbi:hypothetical protein PHYBLDRAFT_72898 [Phycomyces blakesleeanus NRRL 1555(-)]|uniref:Helitron helicase-like domain-containing protein n=1 Tax=Phycomyces blakesleeanus (strain ATCC 8743b / DSM 1359 / FGSC 10004 / NBRC 33097 / NRRL 1555) TaxID=763407 RepID=A0A163ES68_PHYB8|nr:hypothetical protein PHYBLDRAFT_72898 [Phycomyces blakesleeanus NRRL 1555(-)]OAD81210.1 hypothetical protein PHYBLDRAFT_72898 [Phycomyces blakesleeanus NRRL 1555(-)]|eukprot:XP_018299250.1 hypothetical protein PHYBLDRAFT_72898 [Phycomyces blakesleeanus NRRL 1555(-)]
MLSAEKCCASCKLVGHSRSSSSLCPMNKKKNTLNVPQKRTNEFIFIEEYSAESSRSAALRMRIEEEPVLITESVASPVNITSEGIIFEDKDIEEFELDEEIEEEEKEEEEVVVPVAVDNQGQMDVECQHCGALMWMNEKIGSSVLENIKFSMCCGYGKSYNSTLRFTSLGAKIDNLVANNIGGAYNFRIHRTVCHRMGSISPTSDQDLAHSKYAHLYIYDSQTQVQHHQCNAPYLNREIIEKIQSILLNINSFMSLFRSMNQISSHNGYMTDLTLRLIAEGPQDQRRYNAPTADEVAVLIMSNETASSRDIVLHTINNTLQNINEYH